MKFIELLIGLIFKLYFYGFYLGLIPKISFFALIMFLVLLFRLISTCYMTYLDEKIFMSDILEILGKLFVHLQFYMVCLKFDQYLNWRWREIFWVFWLYFALSLGLAIAFLMIFLSKLFMFCIDRNETYKVKGIFWIFVIFFGIAFNTSAFVNSFIEFLEDQDRDSLLIVFFGIIIYTLFFFLYTLLLAKDIVKFLEKVDFDMDSSISLDNSALDFEYEEKKQKKTLNRNPI